jgi:catechol 2,3-dioxygenase-like lactoylglutathione lyase family enzyme
VVERGQELRRDTTRDLDELLYHVFESVTFELACDYERAHRIAGEDIRRQLFARQLELLSSLSPAWAEREASEHRRIQFTIRLRQQGVVAPSEGFHLAFRAPSEEAAKAFHEVALAHGGRDNGGVGFHPEHGPNYFAAFVIDPDGYRIEAVVDEKA